MRRQTRSHRICFCGDGGGGDSARCDSMVASRMLHGILRLRSIIQRTTTTHELLADAAELLREATHDVEKLAYYAFDYVPAIAALPLDVELEAAAKLLAASMFDGPLPGSIDVAQRTVGYLSGILAQPPTTEYPRIRQCGVDLADLTRAFHNAWDGLFISSGFLGFTEGSLEWKHLRVLVVYNAVKSAEATVWLATANMHATAVSCNLCLCWEDPWDPDDPFRADELSSAKVNLQVAMKLMDEALVEMHEVDRSVACLYYKASAIAR